MKETKIDLIITGFLLLVATAVVVWGYKTFSNSSINAIDSAKAFSVSNYMGLAQMGEKIEQYLNEFKEADFSPQNIARVSLLEEIQDVSMPATVDLAVPFASQAPHSNWAMPYQEACEEASLLMVNAFWNEQELNADIADTEILKLVKWEEENDMVPDIDAAQTAEVAENVYSLEAHVYYDDFVTTENIKRFLAAGYPVIIPAAGRALGNPHFTGDGPPYHMLVIKGYNENNFITHDPGTRFGANFQYSFSTIENAIHDWTGGKDKILNGRKAMVVLTHD